MSFSPLEEEEEEEEDEESEEDGGSELLLHSGSAPLVPGKEEVLEPPSKMSRGGGLFPSD